MRIGIVAGEYSGDQLAANLIRALREINSDIQVEGIAGPQMIAAGCNAILPMENIAVMGIVEVLKHIPTILKTRRQITKHFLQNPPDVFIGVDAPDFNLPLEVKLKKHSIKTVHYVSPSVWAWRQGRLKKIARAVNLMLTLLPFEARFYQAKNIPVQFVGHTLADQISVESQQSLARTQLGIAETAKVLALLPGSRANEIEHLGEVFLQTALRCKQQIPELKFITPMVNEARKQQFKKLIQQIAPELNIQIVDGQSREVMAAADVILLASGTATLEAMLVKTSLVVAYKMAKTTYAIAKRLVKTKYIALPNLLADKALVPEFIQGDATVENLSRAVMNYLQNADEINRLQSEFTELHKQLRLNASEHAARAVLELINRAG